MGLMACPDCGREVSDRAPTCPGCGRPLGVPRAPGPRRSGLGIASLVLGLAAAAFAWVPFYGWFTLPFSGLGALLGFLALVTGGEDSRRPGLAVAGLTLSMVALATPLAERLVLDALRG